jgi:hypothetical protein
MFMLWLNGAEVAFTPEDCGRVLALLRRVMAGETCANYHIDGPPPSRPKAYKRPFFKFVSGGEGTRVPKKDWPKLAGALEIGAQGDDSRFAVGIKVISAKCTGIFTIGPDGERHYE